jgi:hypothetical protein
MRDQLPPALYRYLRDTGGPSGLTRRRTHPVVRQAPSDDNVGTEQDLVLEPAAHWGHFLLPRLKGALLKKKRPFASDETTVVVSVTDRET